MIQEKMIENTMMMPTMPPLLLDDVDLSEAGAAYDFNRRQLHRRMVEDCVSLWECSPTAERSLRVLMVDEARCGDEALATLVRSWGHEVRATYDATVGRGMAAAQQPDIVLIGMAAPNFEAIEAARPLRDDSRSRPCFIIGVTDDANEECHRRCLAAGIDLLLIKPIDGFVLQTLLLLEGERLDRTRTAPSTK